MKKLYAAFLAVLALMMALMSPAHAALDVAVTGAITSAQTDLLALYSALTTAGVAIWLGYIIYKKFKVK